MIPNMLAGAIHIEFNMDPDAMMHNFLLPAVDFGFEEEIKTSRRKKV